MNVSYKEFKKIIKLETFQPLISLVSSHHWFLDSLQQRSVYFGYWIEKNEEIIKLIEKIKINEEIKEIEILSEKKINFICPKNTLSLYLDSQGLNFKAINPLFIVIELDNRKLYDTQIKNNNFKIIPQEKSFSIINDEGINFNIFYEGELKFVNRKINIYYDYDRQRNSNFYQNEICQAFEGYVSYLKIFSPDKKPDQSFNFENQNNFKNFILKRILSLYSLKNGFRAGLPWFPQRWFRDELISLLFLDLNFIKENILNYYLENLEKIWQFNKKENSILAADTLPLIINNLDLEKIELEKNRLINLLFQWQKLFNIYEDNLPPQATWMDTLQRKRALEIDFLYYLSLLKLGLTIEAKKFKLFIKKKINLNNYPPEEFLRPNLFFCYFLKKDFFEKSEWSYFFDNLIQSNYLSWGGFSSLNIDNLNFQKKYTGEIPLSYHQGDSWWWLNNLAFYSLKNFNYKKYSKILRKIKLGILKSLFQMGALGYLGELSSAQKLTSEGSPIQLWSLTTLYYNILNKRK